MKSFPVFASAVATSPGGVVASQYSEEAVPAPREAKPGPQPNSPPIDILGAKKYSTPTNPRKANAILVPALASVTRCIVPLSSRYTLDKLLVSATSPNKTPKSLDAGAVVNSA